jgi:hypothetical protein
MYFSISATGLVCWTVLGAISAPVYHSLKFMISDSGDLATIAMRHRFLPYRLSRTN